MEKESVKVVLSDATLRQAAAQGMDAFIDAVVTAISEAAGGELNAEAFGRLNADQITLWGYSILREEVMDGGFVQLIHNGYGPFFFLNPFAKAMRLWGVRDLSKLIYAARKLYDEYGEQIVAPCSQEEFMALFEQYPAFDELDDQFVESEEDFTEAVAHYVDEHLADFVSVEEAAAE